MTRARPPVLRPAVVLLMAMGLLTLPAGVRATSDDQRTAHFYKPANIEGTHLLAPQRIVSLAPVVTETLFALGAGDRVVGVTRFCDRPAAASTLPKVGGFIDPQLEAILALKPELVIAQPSRGVRATLDRLRDHGVAVLVVFGDSLDEVKNLIISVGDAIGLSDVARARVQALDDALGALRRPITAGSRRVLVLVGAKPLVAAGPGTFINEAIELIGARQALRSQTPQWPTLSVETVGALAPDVIVAAGREGDASALRHALAGLGDRRPPIVSGDDAFLMRPGPSLDRDVARLKQLIDEATHR